jgi:hypothetical protein
MHGSLFSVPGAVGMGDLPAASHDVWKRDEPSIFRIPIADIEHAVVGAITRALER